MMCGLCQGKTGFCLERSLGLLRSADVSPNFVIVVGGNFFEVETIDLNQKMLGHSILC